MTHQARGHRLARRSWAAAALLLGLFLALGPAQRPARATTEDAITYTISQSPALGAVLQVGQVLAFSVNITDAPNAHSGPVVFDLRKPANTTYAGFGQQAGNIITSCADNTPSAGYVRCTIGAGGAQPGGALSTGGTEIVINLTIDPSAAGTIYSDNTIAGIVSDPGTGFRNSGDAADTIGGGDSYDASVGGFTVANILGANANITVATAASPAALFEGSLTTVTVSFSHALGSLGPTVQPVDVSVTNGDVQAGTVSCPNGTGVASVTSNTARCTGSTIASGSTLSFQVRTRDTAAGDDLVATLVAPSLGLPANEAASAPAGTAITTVTVSEVGLESTSSPAWALGVPIAVCTATVFADIVSDSAAGSAQAAGVAGTSNLTPVSPLASGDFTVTGPGGAISYSYLDSSTCGGAQSGVSFTPNNAGSYTVTAGYNGDTTSLSTQAVTRGTNVLSLAVQANNPVPAISGLSPATTTAGGGTFTLTVNGSSFVAGSVVRWNGSDRSTTYVNGGQLTATITSADIAAAGSATVTVYNPAPGGGSSGGSTFSIGGAPNPAPGISSLSPSSANAGSAGFTLTVYGTSFVSGATVLWNGANRSTTFISSTQLLATIAAADIASVGTANVSVTNPAPGGGTSLTLPFSIGSAPNGQPSLGSISPSAGNVGGTGFTLTVNGSSFTASSVVRWNGSDRTTTFVSATQLTAAIPASDLAATGSASITVSTPAPGGGTSNAASFAINNPAPAVTGLNPSSAPAASGTFTLTVNGTGFVNGSKVRWNGNDRTTFFTSATQLTATIDAADVANAGTAAVTVFNLAPGGGTSPASTFTITNAAPGTPSLSPNNVVAGSAAFTLTVDGTGFTSASKVRWNGQDRPTVFESATRLTADITAADISAAGTANVVVFTPAPGGGTSPAAVFTIANPLPAVSALSPTSTAANGAAFTLTVTGSNFVRASIVRWNGLDRPTTFVNSGQLTAAITAADILAEGTADVTVFNAAPGGGISASQTFTIGTPATTATDQLVALTGTAGQPFGRSRLTFRATTGNLSGISAVSFVIKRASDGKYWNGATSSWQSDVFANGGTDSDGDLAWTYEVTGAARRQFVSTQVEIEVRATVSGLPYAGTAKPTMLIR
ncbi:MAG: hypothetical protein U0547_02480 [Dehalococcoidia bacterium]